MTTRHLRLREKTIDDMDDWLRQNSGVKNPTVTSVIPLGREFTDIAPPTERKEQ